MLNRKINTSKNLGQADERVIGPEDSVSESDLAAEDNSPAIASLTVQVTHPHGQATPQADIIARTSSPDGWHNKRHIITGHLTAQKLADAILNVGNW